MTEIRRVYKSEEKMKIVMEGLSGTIQKTTESEDKNFHDHEKKKPGAQPGHTGHFRTKSKPNRRIRINLDIHQCPECHSSLRRKGTRKRIIEDIPVIKADIIEY